MTKYIFTKDFPPTGYKKGDLLVVHQDYNFIATLLYLGIIEEVKEDVWPKIGDAYFHLGGSGMIFNSTWHDDIDIKDFLGIYPTKELAEQARDAIRDFVKNNLQK